MESLSVAPEKWIDAALRDAEALGYLGGDLKVHLSGRVPNKLLKAAKQRTGVRSNEKLLVLALSLLAVQDDFGERFLRREGSIDPSLKLDF